jgi:hypothetical protein
VPAPARFYTAYVPGGSGNGLEPLYISAFVLAFISLGLTVQRFARRQRSWVLFLALTILFAFAGIYPATMLVLN